MPSPPPPNDPDPARGFWHRWIVTTLAVLVADWMCEGIRSQGWVGLLVAPLLLGVLNAVVRPVLLLLSLPLLLVTLGLFLWVINAALLLATSALLGDAFRVEGFWAAMWGALIISVVSILANLLAGTGSSRVIFRGFRRGGTRRPPSEPPAGNGPVIDV